VSPQVRYRITMTAILVCAGCLVAVALAPGLRHLLPAGGLFVVLASFAGIGGGLVYLHSTRSRS
jgi:nitrate/nitrite transporter NarK